jgi:hypothetical protein
MPTPLQVSFEQPPHIRRLANRARRELWERKKYLMADSLVLLLQRGRGGDMTIATATVAKRDADTLGQDRPWIGLSCSGATAEGDFKKLLTWLKRGEQPEGGAKEKEKEKERELILIQTRSNYISCAPILRALQGMAQQGAPLPLQPQLLPGPGAAPDDMPNEPPAYLVAQGSVLGVGVYLLVFMTVTSLYAS